MTLALAGGRGRVRVRVRVRVKVRTHTHTHTHTHALTLTLTFSFFSGFFASAFAYLLEKLRHFFEANGAVFGGVHLAFGKAECRELRQCGSSIL